MRSGVPGYWMFFTDMGIRELNRQDAKAPRSRIYPQITQITQIMIFTLRGFEPPTAVTFRLICVICVICG
jgi:hypothetical protein